VPRAGLNTDRVVAEASDLRLARSFGRLVHALVPALPSWRDDDDG